jgi:hypothetical protein
MKRKTLKKKVQRSTKNLKRESKIAMIKNSRIEKALVIKMGLIGKCHHPQRRRCH